jgi:hypothetical protein
MHHGTCRTHGLRFSPRCAGAARYYSVLRGAASCRTASTCCTLFGACHTAALQAAALRCMRHRCSPRLRCATACATTRRSSRPGRSGPARPGPAPAWPGPRPTAWRGVLVCLCLSAACACQLRELVAAVGSATPVLTSLFARFSQQARFAPLCRAVEQSKRRRASFPPAPARRCRDAQGLA